jgi:hypothetical protein
LVEEFEKRKQNESEESDDSSLSEYSNTKFDLVENINNFVIYSCSEGSGIVYLLRKF